MSRVEIVEIIIGVGNDGRSQRSTHLTELVDAINSKIPNADDIVSCEIKESATFDSWETKATIVYREKAETLLVTTEDVMQNQRVHLANRTFTQREVMLMCSICYDNAKEFSKMCLTNDEVFEIAQGFITEFLDSQESNSGQSDLQNLYGYKEVHWKHFMNRYMQSITKKSADTISSMNLFGNTANAVSRLKLQLGMSNETILKCNWELVSCGVDGVHIDDNLEQLFEFSTIAVVNRDKSYYELRQNGVYYRVPVVLCSAGSIRNSEHLDFRLIFKVNSGEISVFSTFLLSEVDSNRQMQSLLSKCGTEVTYNNGGVLLDDALNRFLDSHYLVTPEPFEMFLTQADKTYRVPMRANANFQLCLDFDTMHCV